MKYTKISFEKAEGFDKELIEKASVSMFENNNINDDENENSDSNSNAAFMRAVKAALRGVVETGLAPRQKQIFVMYYLKNMKSPEIAEKLGISPQAVTKSLRASRHKIAEYLKYCFEKR